MTGLKTVRGIMANAVTVSDLAKEVRSASTTSTDSTHTNERSREDEHNNGVPLVKGRVCSIESIYYRDR